MIGVWIGLAVAGWSAFAVAVAVLVGRSIRLREKRSPRPTKDNPPDDDWCDPDGLPSILCGGPHPESVDDR